MTPEEKREDEKEERKARIIIGASLIAVVVAGGSLFLAVTSGSMSITPTVVLILVVLVAAYLTFAYPLAVISSGLVLLIIFLFAVVEFLKVAVPVVLKTGVFLLGAAAVLYFVYLFVTT